MAKRLSPKSTLATLKTEAKRRLKAMRADAPDTPLRAAQLAVARAYGFDGWPDLKAALDGLALSRLTPAERVDIVLRQAWQGDRPAAERILARHREVVDANLLTAVVFGDLDAVTRRLAEDPIAANAKAGPLDWPPLLYLAYSRLPVPAAGEHAAAIATALLDAGADPNAAFDDGWGNPFKAITGLIGLGEGVRTPHPRAAELVALLIARGADPFDTQALYDSSIVSDDTTWLDILYTASDPARWKAVANGLGGRFKPPAIDYLLGNAVAQDHRARAAWLLHHGADPNGIHAYSGRPHRVEAELSGFTEMAALLARHGATAVTLKPQQAFQAAAMALDTDAARRVAQAHPQVLADPAALIQAAGLGRAEVVGLLLALGVPPDLPQPDGRRALHSAASSSSIETARLLVEAGADIDARGTQYDGSPLGFALYGGGGPQMVAYLGPLSRDVMGLATAGMVERLEAVLDAEPALAAARDRNGQTTLFRLPDDEDAAVSIARLLLAHGVDPKVEDKDGLTAAKAARQRGLDEAADLIDGPRGR